MNNYPFIFSDEKKYRLRRHLSFWIFWWLFQGVIYSFINGGYSSHYWQSLVSSTEDSMVFMLVHISFSYALMYFVIPRYLLRQKYWLMAVWVFIFALYATSLSTFLALYILPKMHHYHVAGGMHIYKNEDITLVQIGMGLMAGLRGAITVGGIAAAIKLMKYFYIKEQRNLQLQKENMEAQLQLLKGQVHPHFLFNTLNNIYSYTQETSPIASALVLGLSDMMRYMLYECNQPLVPLRKDLKMLQDYLALEMIRYDERLDIHVNLPVEDHGLLIAPLVLLPFIENSFKHGASVMPDQPWIHLDVVIRENVLVMKLMNGKPSRKPANHQPGIGISNVQRRLELLYGNGYQLLIQEEEDVFIVNLELTLETKENNKQLPVL